MSQLIPLDKIRPSKDNVRAKVGDVAELARSIESRGLLEPIVVRPAADKPGYFDLTAGHRRYAAHQKLKRTEIDAIVRDSAGLDHVVDMLVENLQREGISPQEKCLAFQRFVEELGWTQQRIADTIGIKQSSVSKCLALQKLPKAYFDRVGKRKDSGGISLEGAAELLKLVDYGEEYLRLAVECVEDEGEDWDVAVRGVLLQAERDKVVATATEALKAEGVKVVEYPRVGGWHLGKTRPLGREWGVTVNKAQHQKMPCHAAAIRGTGEVIYVCTNPLAHAPKAGASARRVQVNAQQAAKKAEQKELEEAASVRRIAIRVLVRGKQRKLDDLAVFLLRQLVSSGAGIDHDELVFQFLGVEPVNRTYEGRRDALNAYIDKGPEFASRMALALALAVVEDDMDGHWHNWGAPELAHLQYLVRHAGYHPAEVELRKLGAIGEQLTLPGTNGKAKASVDVAEQRALAGVK